MCLCVRVCFVRRSKKKQTCDKYEHSGVRLKRPERPLYGHDDEEVKWAEEVSVFSSGSPKKSPGSG